MPARKPITPKADSSVAISPALFNKLVLLMLRSRYNRLGFVTDFALDVDKGTLKGVTIHYKEADVSMYEDY